MRRCPFGHVVEAIWQAAPGGRPECVEADCAWWLALRAPDGSTGGRCVVVVAAVAVAEQTAMARAAMAEQSRLDKA